MVSPLPDAPVDAVQPDAAASTAQRVVAVDVGAVYTKAYVLQEVEGERRLVAIGLAPTRADNGLLVLDSAVERAVAQALSRAGDALPATPAAGGASLQGYLTSVAGVPRVAIVVTRDEDARAIGAALESLPLHLHEPVILDSAADT